MPFGRMTLPALAFAGLLLSVAALAQVATETPPATEAAPAAVAAPGSIQAKVHLLSRAQPMAGGPFAADEMLFASDSGVYVMRGVDPDVASTSWFVPIRQLRTEGGGVSHYGNVLRTAEGNLLQAGETVLDLPWPEDTPAFYLEEQAPNLFRRVELADRQGYSVTLRRTAGAPDKVDALLVQQSFAPTRYDNTIQSYVGRPTLLKTVWTATAPLKPGMATVLLWTDLWRGGRGGLNTAASKRWGVWTLILDGDRELEATVYPDGPVWVPVPFAKTPIELLETRLDAEGGLSVLFVGLQGRPWKLTGKLNEDGTGAGRLEPLDGGEPIPWTATRKPGETRDEGESAAGSGRGGGYGGGGLGGGLGGGRGGGGFDGVAAVALVLTAPNDLMTAMALEVLQPAKGKPVTQVGIRAHLCTLDRGSDEWKSIAAADDAGARLAELIAAGKVKPLSAPHVNVQDGDRAVIQQSTELPYFVPDPQTGKPALQRLELPFELALTPQALEEGQLRLTVECRVGTLAGWVVGPLKEEVPVVAYQTITAHIRARDGQPTIVLWDAAAKRSPAFTVRGDAQDKAGQETLLLLTARVLEDGATAPATPR